MKRHPKSCVCAAPAASPSLSAPCPLPEEHELLAALRAIVTAFDAGRQFEIPELCDRLNLDFPGLLPKYPNSLVLFYLGVLAEEHLITRHCAEFSHTTYFHRTTQQTPDAGSPNAAPVAAKSKPRRRTTHQSKAVPPPPALAAPGTPPPLAIAHFETLSPAEQESILLQYRTAIAQITAPQRSLQTGGTTDPLPLRRLLKAYLRKVGYPPSTPPSATARSKQKTAPVRSNSRAHSSPKPSRHTPKTEL